MKRNVLLIAIFAALLAGLAPALAAAEALKAVRVVQGPKIDGGLDDAAWASAVPVSSFRMFEPTAGAAPTEKTELRILYDESSLYIGVLCYESEPGRISSNTLAHDAAGAVSMGYGYGMGGSTTVSDDLIRVLIDPFQDKRTARFTGR